MPPKPKTLAAAMAKAKVKRRAREKRGTLTATTSQQSTLVPIVSTRVQSVVPRSDPDFDSGGQIVTSMPCGPEAQQDLNTNVTPAVEPTYNDEVGGFSDAVTDVDSEEDSVVDFDVASSKRTKRSPIDGNYEPGGSRNRQHTHPITTRRRSQEHQPVGQANEQDLEARDKALARKARAVIVRELDALAARDKEAYERKEVEMVTTEEYQKASGRDREAMKDDLMVRVGNERAKNGVYALYVVDQLMMLPKYRREE